MLEKQLELDVDEEDIHELVGIKAEELSNEELIKLEEKKVKKLGDFPGGPVVKTSPSKAGGVGLIPGRGVKIPHASQPKTPKHKTEAIL